MSGIFENLGIDSGIIIIILLILTIFLLVRNISMNMRLSRLERKYKTFMKGSDAQSLEKVFVRKFAQIDKLYDAKEEHDHDLLFIKKILRNKNQIRRVFIIPVFITAHPKYLRMIQTHLKEYIIQFLPSHTRYLNLLLHLQDALADCMIRRLLHLIHLTIIKWFHTYPLRSAENSSI